jgi:hypothetical protein
MQGIETEEKIAIPTMQVSAPPRQVCVTISFQPTEGEHWTRDNEFFHEDFPQGFDLDGKFRARVGVALSEALTKPPVVEGVTSATNDPIP